MMWTRRIALTALLVAVPATLAQRNIYVDGVNGNDAWDGRCRAWNGQTCGPKKTIQAGIDAAMPGDTILIADGVYSGPGNFNNDLRGKNLTIEGESGAADRCVIDPQFVGRGFYLHSAETAAFADLTIRNGLVVKDSPGYAAGAGIYCASGVLTVRGCVLTDHEARDFNGSGPAIYVQYGTLNMQNCTVRDNVSGGNNGGVYAQGPTAVIQDCQFERNRSQARLSGAAALTGYTEPAPTLVQRCTFRGNVNASAAGAVHFWRSAVLEDCLFENNAGKDGAAKSDGTSTVVRRCIFRDNYAYDGSGAIHTRALTLENSVLAGNRAARGAGAVYGGPMTIVNCTIVANDSPYGAAINPLGPTTLANCIVYFNRRQPFGDNVTATYCDVQGGWWGEGNIDADPKLAFEGDVHLTAESPCIDRGTNSPPGGLPTTDFDGNPRPLPPGGVADMGAYEFNTAKPSIATSTRNVPFSVPLDGRPPAPQTLGIRNAGGNTLRWRIAGECPWLSITPRSGESTGEIDPVALQADPAGLPHGQYSCELRVEDPGAVNGPIAVSVVLGVTASLDVPTAYPNIQAAMDAAVDGDVIRLADGRYTGPGNRAIDFRGKQVLVRSASGDAEKCVIDCEGTPVAFYLRERLEPVAGLCGLTITNAAGGYFESTVIVSHLSAPTVRKCHFIGNSASALLTEDDSRPLILDCLLAQNTTGVEVRGGAPELRRCVLRDNHNPAPGSSGGLRLNQSYSYPGTIVSDCVFLNNSGDTGGAIGVYYSNDADVRNSSFYGNTARWGGGAFAIDDVGWARLENCVFWGNAAPRGAELALIRGYRGVGTLAVRYCDVRGGREGVHIDGNLFELYWGPGNLDADPLFVDPGIGDLHLKPGSPCIDTGDPTLQPPPGATDIDRQKRVWDGDRNGIAVVDIGADEFGSFVYGDLNCDGVINNFDIDPFVLALTDPAGYGQKFPDCDRLLADTNGDGKVDNFNIDPFVKLLSGS